MVFLSKCCSGRKKVNKGKEYHHQPQLTNRPPRYEFIEEDYANFPESHRDLLCDGYRKKLFPNEQRMPTESPTKTKTESAINSLRPAPAGGSMRRATFAAGVSVPSNISAATQPTLTGNDKKSARGRTKEDAEEAHTPNSIGSARELKKKGQRRKSKTILTKSDSAIESMETAPPIGIATKATASRLNRGVSVPLNASARTQPLRSTRSSSRRSRSRRSTRTSRMDDDDGHYENTADFIGDNRGVSVPSEASARTQPSPRSKSTTTTSRSSRRRTTTKTAADTGSGVYENIGNLTLDNTQ